MNDEKWQNIIDMIEEKFGIEKRYTEEDNITDDTGKTYKGTKESVVFNGLNGKMKIVRITHPLIEDKKMHYHKGTGGTARIEYSVSETEKTYKLEAYMWDGDEWQKIDMPSGNISF